MKMCETQMPTNGYRGRRRHYLVLVIVFFLATASLSQGQPSPAAAYYNRGNERYKKGDLNGAIEDYDAALTFNSVVIYTRAQANGTNCGTLRNGPSELLFSCCRVWRGFD